MEYSSPNPNGWIPDLNHPPLAEEEEKNQEDDVEIVI